MQTEDDRNAAHTNAALLLIIYVSRLRGRAAHYMHSGLSAANTHRGLNADFIKGGFIAAYMHNTVVLAQPIGKLVSAQTTVYAKLFQRSL